MAEETEVSDGVAAGEASPFPLPELPSRYRLVRELGSGGMGIVALVHDQELDRLIALKILRSSLELDPVVIERFRREAQVMARVDHPNLARVFGFELEPFPHLAMEYVEGADLLTCLEEGERLAGEDVLSLAEPLAGAVDALHEAGVLHRDIKPQNILIRAADGLPVLTDMGLVAMGGAPALTATHMIVGTPRFLPPEVVLDGAWSRASDVFQLAAVLFRALVGYNHVGGETPGELAHRIARCDFHPIPEDLEDVSDAVRRGITAGLSRDPRDRPASGAALVAMLRDEEGVCLPPPDQSATRLMPEVRADAPRGSDTSTGERPLPAPAPSPVAAPGPGVAPGWRLPALVVLLLGGVALGAWTAGQARPPPPPPSPVEPSPEPPPAPSPIPPGRLLSRLDQHTDLVGGLAFSPGGRYLASVAADSSLGVWEVDTGAPVGWRPPLEAGLSFALAFSPGGRRLATGGFDGAVTIRRLPDAEVVETVPAPEGAAALVRAVSFLDDEELLLADDRGRVRTSGKRGARALGAPVRALLLLPDGDTLAAAVGDTVRLVSRSTGEVRGELKAHVAPIVRLALASRGGQLASASRDAIILWDLPTRTPARVIRGVGGAVALAPDGAWAAVPVAGSGVVRVLALPGGATLVELAGHEEPVTALAVAPSGARLASADAGGGIRLWDLRELEGTPGPSGGSQGGKDGVPTP
jgi:serine/threonine-protein kinase